MSVTENVVDAEQYKIKTEPYYEPVGEELTLYESAYDVRMPMMIKGPTGCGKSRFVEHMAWKLGKPLITVACNEDMTASDLVGRFLLDKDGTKWQDGPLTTAARWAPSATWMKSLKRARTPLSLSTPLPTIVARLPLDKKGELIEAHPDFQLVISYNPGYQSLMKDLKQSTKQRFGAMDFDYPEEKIETNIVAKESGVDAATAEKLVQIAHRARNLKGHGLDEGISTRLLVYSGQLIAKGVDAKAACIMTMVTPLTDDPDMRDTLNAAVETFFG